MRHYMRPLILTLTLSILFANIAIGQTMQTVIDNLMRHKLIEEENKQDVELILKRKEDTSPSAIFQALMYVEMVKMAGREHMSEDFASVAPYLKMPITESTREHQDSINKELSEYLTKLKSAELVNDTIYKEIKANIEKGSYLIQIMLIDDLVQKTEYSQYFSPDILKQFEKTYLTQKQIEDAVSGWQKAGILNHLTKEQISEALKKTHASNYENLNDLVINFPSIVHWFDLELENLNDPYTELIKEISNISHGVFKPTNVSDNFRKPVKNKVTLQFSLNKKSYSKTLQLQDDWIDTDFFDFVKQVVAENKLDGRFYELYEGGQGGIIIFLKSKQYQYLKTNKLLVFEGDE